MIYLIITTSINNKIGINNNDHRKTRYIESIESCLKFIGDNIKPIIVENNGLRPTYLDQFNCDVLYTNNNEHSFHHKGINELLDIKEVINKYDIKDDDFIIKLTGRYKVLNDTFFNTIRNDIETYDAFVKFFNVCTKHYMSNDCVLGLLAIKCKYIRNFIYDDNLGAEMSFAAMIRRSIEPNKIMEVLNLDLECCFADDHRILCV